MGMDGLKNDSGRQIFTSNAYMHGKQLYELEFGAFFVAVYLRNSKFLSPNIYHYCKANGANAVLNHLEPLTKTFDIFGAETFLTF